MGKAKNKIDLNIVTQDEWLAARTDVLGNEKECTRPRDELSRERRKLPMVKVEKEYVFDGPCGPLTLFNLFEGRRQLIAYHFMFDRLPEAWSI
jgi:predicted dithiol-disulfide oxidoreductase (DUF899 family)